MSDRPPSGLTPGDPLGGSPHERPSEGLWSGTPGYTSPAPPGAGGPRPAALPAGLGGGPVLSGWWRRAGAQVIEASADRLSAACVGAYLRAKTRGRA